MADINDWEEYEETTEKAGKLNLNDKKNNFESEEIIKPKEEKKTSQTKKVDKKENEAKAPKTESNPSNSLINVGDNKESILNPQGSLVNEKDFVDLAVLSVAKIKDANKLNKFTLSYLKKNLEELGPSLETGRIDELIKNLTVLFNKKRKEESEKYGKKPKSKQPSIVAGKALDSAAAKGKLDVYDDEEYSDEYEADDFM